jgi:hypothetical protein
MESLQKTQKNVNNLIKCNTWKHPYLSLSTTVWPQAAAGDISLPVLELKGPSFTEGVACYKITFTCMHWVLG